MVATVLFGDSYFTPHVCGLDSHGCSQILNTPYPLPCPHNFFTSSFLHFLSNFFAFNIEGIEGTSSVTSPNTGSIFRSMVLQHWQDVKIRLWGFTKKAFTPPTQCNGVHEKRVDDSPCPWETRRIKSRTQTTHVYWIM